MAQNTHVRSERQRGLGVGLAEEEHNLCNVLLEMCAHFSIALRSIALVLGSPELSRGLGKG